jgi:hypothetical protein
MIGGTIVTGGLCTQVFGQNLWLIQSLTDPNFEPKTDGTAYSTTLSISTFNDAACKNLVDGPEKMAAETYGECVHGSGGAGLVYQTSNIIVGDSFPSFSGKTFGDKTYNTIDSCNDMDDENLLMKITIMEECVAQTKTGPSISATCDGSESSGDAVVKTSLYASSDCSGDVTPTPANNDAPSVSPNGKCMPTTSGLVGFESSYCESGSQLGLILGVTFGILFLGGAIGAFFFMKKKAPDAGLAAADAQAKATGVAPPAAGNTV